MFYTSRMHARLTLAVLEKRPIIYISFLGISVISDAWDTSIFPLIFPHEYNGMLHVQVYPAFCNCNMILFTKLTLDKQSD